MLHLSHSRSEFMQSLIADRKAFFSVLRTEGLGNEIKVNLNYTHTHTHIRLTTLCPGLPG